jgi:hypothetical protein
MRPTVPDSLFFLGPELGLRGVSGAALDHCAFSISQPEQARFVSVFTSLFSLDHLFADLVQDVNQQQADATRLVDRALLATWAGNGDANGGFASHSIFYDEDRPQDFGGLAPTAENMFQPFLTPSVARDTFLAVFAADLTLGWRPGGSSEEAKASEADDSHGDKQGPSSLAE